MSIRAEHPMNTPVTLRRAEAADWSGVIRLAALDSAAVPKAPLLLAEVGGELVAALSMRDGAVIADPFRLTAPVVGLLRTAQAPSTSVTGIP